MKYNETLLEEAVRIKRDKGMKWEDLADYMRSRYGILVSGNALRKACASYIKMQDRLNDIEVAEDLFLQPFVEDYDDFITVQYKDSMVVSDVHAPFYNAILANKMIKVARKNGVKRLYIIGDLFDAKTYSRFPTANNMSSSDAEEEIRSISEFFRVCSTQFEDIYYCPGNHEIRMLNKLERKLQFKTLLKMAMSGIEQSGTVIHVTEYPRILMKGINRPDTWLGHPRDYSRIRGRIPSRLASVFHTNIVTGHTHHLSLSTDDSNRYYTVETGCLADPSKQEYLAMEFTDLPVWHPGFVMIKNERPVLFDDGMITDWDMWLGE